MSTIIKAGQAGELLQRLSTVDLVDYLDEARQMVREAKQKAAVIIADAERRAKILEQEAHERGYAEGVTRGEQEGRRQGYDAAHDEAMARFEQEQADLVSDVTRVIDELDRMHDDVRETAERDLLDLAMLVARKLTFAIGEVHRASALENLRRALTLVSQQRRLQVRVHPRDLETIREYAASVLARAEASPSVVIEPDESMAPGGCKVTGLTAEIDASLEAQVAELVSLLVGERNADD